MERVYQEKKDFVSDLCVTLRGYPDLDVADLCYYKRSISEYVKIDWRSGGYTWIDVSADSLTAIMAEIVLELKDAGARGRVENPDKVKHLNDITDWEK